MQNCRLPLVTLSLTLFISMCGGCNDRVVDIKFSPPVNLYVLEPNTKGRLIIVNSIESSLDDSEIDVIPFNKVIYSNLEKTNSIKLFIDMVQSQVDKGILVIAYHNNGKKAVIKYMNGSSINWDYESGSIPKFLHS